jgi:LAO/AO transport system kinase
VTIDISTRAGLARAITQVESRRADHQAQARELLAAAMPKTGKAQRIGITGVPGVGKSTFIDAFGTMLLDKGHRVAVLAVDPTSRRSGGSILGDKTRMARLAADERAFIRPSPAGETLGGVSRKTRETMLLCEAAGYDVVLVETVGVGQSETVVADMVDFFLVLMLPNAGDELQGIKKGVLEVADLIAVNKADIDAKAAKRAARAYEVALHIMEPASPDWSPPVHTVSGFTGDGLPELWATIETHRKKTEASGSRAKRRADQQVR